MGFQKATKENVFLRFAIQGVSGAGKTYSALAIASGLGEKIAVIDTESGSACRYADLFDFDTQDLKDFHPNSYIRTIQEAAKCNYDVLIIDSLTHAWYWELEAVDKKFQNWGQVRPLERKLIQTILSYPGHIILTMRSKAEWIIEDAVNGQGRATKSPKKVGMAPIQSPGIEYEFDLVGDLGLDHTMTIIKSRFFGLDNVTEALPDREFGKKILACIRNQQQPDAEFKPPVLAPAPEPESEPKPVAPVAAIKPIAEMTDAELVAEFKAFCKAKGVAVADHYNSNFKEKYQKPFKELSTAEKQEVVSVLVADTPPW